MARKRLYSDCYWNELRPNVDYSKIEEITSDFSKYQGQLEKYSFLTPSLDPVSEEEAIQRRKRKSQLLKGVYEKAAQILTNDQLQIFLLYYTMKIPQEQIAKILKVTQPYVCLSLKNSVQKLKKVLDPFNGKEEPKL